MLIIWCIAIFIQLHVPRVMSLKVHLTHLIRCTTEILQKTYWLKLLIVLCNLTLIFSFKKYHIGKIPTYEMYNVGRYAVFRVTWVLHFFSVGIDQTWRLATPDKMNNIDLETQGNCFVPVYCILGRDLQHLTLHICCV